MHQSIQELNYGISVYDQACDSRLKRIKTLQKDVSKNHCKEMYIFFADMLHNDFEFLNFNDIVKK